MGLQVLYSSLGGVVSAFLPLKCCSSSSGTPGAPFNRDGCRTVLLSKTLTNVRRLFFCSVILLWRTRLTTPPTAFVQRRWTRLSTPTLDRCVHTAAIRVVS